VPLQTQNTSFSPQDAYNSIRSNAAGVKAQAQNALTSLQNGSVTSDFIFRMLDQLIGVINALNSWKTISGLDAYATGQGYTGTLSADCTTCANAGTSCINWVTANFPASGGFIQAYTLNVDGTRTPRSFTSAQTAGLQTALQAFIATIG
jgi:hypothetical protein